MWPEQDKDRDDDDSEKYTSAACRRKAFSTANYLSPHTTKSCTDRRASANWPDPTGTDIVVGKRWKRCNFRIYAFQCELHNGNGKKLSNELFCHCVQRTCYTTCVVLRLLRLTSSLFANSLRLMTKYQTVTRKQLWQRSNVHNAKNNREKIYFVCSKGCREKLRENWTRPRCIDCDMPRIKHVT